MEEYEPARFHPSTETRALHCDLENHRTREIHSEVAARNKSSCPAGYHSGYILERQIHFESGLRTSRNRRYQALSFPSLDILPQLTQWAFSAVFCNLTDGSFNPICAVLAFQVFLIYNISGSYQWVAWISFLSINCFQSAGGISMYKMIAFSTEDCDRASTPFRHPVRRHPRPHGCH